MTTIPFEYSLDCGVLGIRKAAVTAKCASGVTGQVLVELSAVELGYKDRVALDVLDYLSANSVEAMKQVAYSMYLRQRMSGAREGSAAEGAAV